MALIRTVKKAEGIKPIPSDIYQATFANATEESGKHGSYFKLEFEISNGTYKGEKRTILASDKLTRGPKGNSKLLDIIETLSGKKFDFDKDLDIESFYGKECRIVVDEATEKNGITIQGISKVLPPKVD